MKFVAFTFFAFASIGYAQHPPNPPVITEPQQDGQVVNPEDVHMETAPMSDPDSGDIHQCSDWEIVATSPFERIWAATCVTGAAKVHIHLGDGSFLGSHAGRHSLLEDTTYQLRVRHRDNTNLWSPWADRILRTAPASLILSLELEDIAEMPTPEWRDEVDNPIVLRPGSPPASLRIESPQGRLLLAVQGFDGVNNALTNPPPLSDHVTPRIVITGGSSGISRPKSNLRFTDGHGASRVIFLPVLSVASSETKYIWVSSNGSTFWGTAEQQRPDFSQLAQGTPIPWTIMAPGYTVEIVSTGYQLPVNIAFVPNPGTQPSDPLYYVTELYGTIKVVKRNGTVGTYATDLLNFDPTGNFPGSGEQGLSGIVVEQTTGDIFASMLYDPPPPGGNHYPKVVRFHSVDGGLTAGTQTSILEMPSDPQGQSHFISNLTIGPDEKLYVHMGDGLEWWTAQSLDSFRGKILRMNLDGSAPTDNPFYNAQNGITPQDYVFAYGFRNPFGGAWRSSDSSHYQVENGPGLNDRFAKVIAGRNFGWDGQSGSMTAYATYNWFQTHAPVNISFVQPSTFGGSGFPADKQDHAFVTESGPTWATGTQERGKRVVEFVLDSLGRLVDGPITLVEYSGYGKATAAALAAGPDGLYFSDLYKDQNYASAIDRGANILRIRYTGVVGPSSTQLLSFTYCIADRGRIRLEWTTSVEAGLHGFEVQRSISEPISFGSINNGFVAGHVSSTTPNTYFLIDSLSTEGVWLYRLKLINTDSTVRYSNAMRVNIPDRDRDCAPRAFALDQNYPNPFNPTTEIRFSVDNTSQVSLQVYNLLGERVTTLFTGIAESGRYYTVSVDGARLSSGVYFYQLETNGRTKVRKMMVLK
jgi:glucose/arabinose dehydrogenase